MRLVCVNGRPQWPGRRAPALGISGWKLDFGEEYLDRSKPLSTFAGPKTISEYGEAYYRDYLAHGVLKKR